MLGLVYKFDISGMLCKEVWNKYICRIVNIGRKF